mmetsp:Transcript_31698/g.45018  ORF Transcript_31698/g.45018 Transcript_31698/m.45018 type:complete len:347 (+) Transcript_31698:2-1042(+)
MGTLVLTLRPQLVLNLVLSPEAASMEVAIPYLRLRALSMIPQLVTATCSAAFRGTRDTKTPFFISLVASAIKLALDPQLIFRTSLGAAGATISTLVAETFGGVTSLYFLTKRKLVDIGQIFKLPSKKTLTSLLSAGVIMFIRQAAINAITLACSKNAMNVDTAGVAAAAYGIVMQMYTCGFVVHVAVQGAAAAIIPFQLVKHGKEEARAISTRLFQFSALTGLSLGIIQAILAPLLIPLFTPLEEVREAAKIPALISGLLHVVNGPRFVGEGTMMGLGSLLHLSGITVVGMCGLIAALRTRLGESLGGVMVANLLFCSYQTLALLFHHYFVGKLSRRQERGVIKKY